MAGRWHPWFTTACVLAALSPGCGAPSTFTVETVVHPDGSCDRTICQPWGESLPAEALPHGRADRREPEPPLAKPKSAAAAALRPEWVACWKSVADVKGPPASPRQGRGAGSEAYFLARGTFRSPREIPPHYRRADADVPQAGVSELVRSYERIDRVFVVEHRWSERVTDVVTLAGFLEARDKILDILLPLGLRLLGEEFGPDYDLSGLSAFVRGDVRRALEEASVLVYDAGVRRRLRHGDTIDPELVARLVALVRRLGFDPLDASGKPLSSPELDRRIEESLRRVMLEHVRHRDGSALEGSEWDALFARWRKKPGFMKLDERQEERLRRFVEPLVPRMMGMYGVPLALFFPNTPRFAFALQLPGVLIETNGVGLGNGRTRWSFAGDEVFPDGYEMRARSLEIDRDAQRKALGRVAIDDEESALEFVELVGEKGALLEAVRKLKVTGDRGALAAAKGRSSEQDQRSGRLCEMLLGR
jgi:hypothetical protein